MFASNARFPEAKGEVGHLIADACIGVSDCAAFQHGPAACCQCQAAGDVQQISNLILVQPVQGGQRGGGAECSPGAVGMHAHAQSGADTGACCHIIADDEGAKEFLPCNFDVLSGREQCRKDMHAGRPPCELASFIHLQHGPSHAIEKSGCQEIRAQACAEDCRVTVRLLHGGEPQHFRFGHAADNCAHAVGYDEFGSGNGLRGYVIHLSLGNELRHVRKKERTHRLSHRAKSPVRQFSSKIACW